MKAKIYCHKIDKKHHFYVSVKGVEYFLFCQNYKEGVEQYFSKPLIYDEAINFSKAQKSFSIMNTMRKLPMYVEYVEKYYGVALTYKGKKRLIKNKSKVICA